VTWETLRSSLPLVPALALGIFAGDLLHGHVSERAFRFVVFALLLVAAIGIAVRALAE
jgi:uncharacterized membrane protein YfcA